jgi:uncharacterized protein YjbI with pentapeptide repeats
MPYNLLMPEEEQPSRRAWWPLVWQRRWWIALATLFILVWWLLPLWLYRHTGTDKDAKLEAITGTRTALLAGLIGVGALLTFWLNSRVYRITARTFEVTEQGHITERYTKAIEQLGGDKLAVRLGGIYALERLAQDSPQRDHPTVVEVLGSFVREGSQQHSPSPPTQGTTDEAAEKPDATAPGIEAKPRPTTDVQAALSVLGRLPQRPNVSRGDLAGAQLAGAQLDGANLTGAQLGETNLSGAQLTKADLLGAQLTKADLLGAQLDGANLRAAILWSANLSYTPLVDANLSGAQLYVANLSNAQLDRADLSNARLDQADLSNAVLNGADLSNAYLVGANLSNAALSRANLTGAHPVEANLSGAQLDGAKLSDAALVDTDLSGARLDMADLSGARLDKANLSGAQLVGAKLLDAALRDADLSGAQLDGADLRRALGLTQPQLDAARGNAETQLPAGLGRPARWAAAAPPASPGPPL